MKYFYKFVLFLLPKKYKSLLQKFKLGYQLTTSESSYLVQTGYVNSSINHTLRDKNNEYVPWMNYPFIDFLKEKISNDLIVFEYGSGASTIFFAKKTKKIISVEYDREWYEKIKNVLLDEVDNGTVHYEELNDTYPKSIEKYMINEKCDIVIIDGRKRVKCAKIAYKYLSEKGVVIFDDSYRQYYSDGIKFYKEKGFKTITFRGIKPTGIGTDQTTLIYRDGNCLGV